nr:BTAD domain-containing putative transcriptional regulator [Micromonospora sp. DSM 115978]
MEFRILGPVEARRDGELIGIGSRRQLSVLATLLLDAGRVVPVERLARATWGDSAPSTARAQVHSCVSALRRRFAPAEPIITRSAGYLIAPDPDSLDLLTFERAVRSARVAVAEAPDRAVELLRQALALWRGPALAGLDGSILGPGATSLEERRLLAWEELADLELSLGRHAALVPELCDLVAAEPLRERLVAQLMIALYRAGRPAEALEAYRRTRRLLVDCQGLEPGLELRRLEQRILTTDPSLGSPQPAGLVAGRRPPTQRVPATEVPLRAGAVRPADEPAVPGPDRVPPVPARPCQLPPVIADFTGRRQAVRRVEAMLAGTTAGLPIIAVSGPAGVGKSSLALHLAHNLRAAFPDGQLYADLLGMRDEPVRPFAALGRLLRSVGVADNAQGDTVDERAVQFRDAVADRRMLLVLDDAQSAAQLRPLLPGTASCAVIVTSRRLLGGLEGAEHLALETFERSEAVALLTRIVGERRAGAEPAAVAEIARLCGGLPLAVRIAGARLAARPRWQVAELAGRLAGELGRLDELATGDLAVRASLALSYRALPEPARKLLRLASLPDAPDVPAWVGAALLDLPSDEGERLLEMLVDACLLDVATVAGSGPRYRMHDLIRLFARERAGEEDTESDRRAALERAIGAWLARAECAEVGLPARSLAAIRGEAPRWTGPPGSASERSTVDAVGWFESERIALAASIHQAAERDMAALAWNLAAAVQPFYELRGVHDDAQQTHRAALAACERAGDQLGAAVLRRNLADLWTSRPGADPRDKLAAAESALSAFRRLDEPRGVADALWLCADAHRINGRHGAAATLLAEALAIAAAERYELGECHALAQMAIISREQGRYSETLTLARRYLVLARRMGQGREESVALTLLGLAHRELGQSDAGRHALRQALAVARQTGDRIQETYSLARLGSLYAVLGDERARPTLAEALDRSHADGLAFGQALALAGLGELALTEGCPGSAIGPLRRATELLGDRRFAFVRAQAFAGLGRAHAGAGDSAAAAEHWSAAIALYRQIGNDTAAGEVATLLSAVGAPAGSE